MSSDLTSPSVASARSEAITPARLEELLAAATPGPWFVVEDERPGMEWNRHICWDEHGDHRVAFMASDAGTEANASLIALSPALAARVIELEAEVERLREVLGDMLDDCEPDRPGAPRLSIREAARAVLNGGDYEA